jgi:hypothetical protein
MKQPKVTGPSRAEEMKWRAEDDLRTLQRAQEIQADKARMGMAKRMAAQQVKALSKVAGKSRGKR